jgi:histidyl-tRNA synthetase
MMARKSNIKLAKGVKDWYGKQALLRNHVREIVKRNFERYGFNPVETPLIERQEILGLKGGGEIQKEIFRLHDQGKRDLALRFDHTVPLARFYASHLELKIPYKRYTSGEVFRDGPTQPEQGRYRIFTQCDADIIGVDNMAAEAELLTLASDVFKSLGLGGVKVKINNRKVLEGVMERVEIGENLRPQTILILDKLEKIGSEGVKKELAKIPLPESVIDNLIENLVIEGSGKDKMEFLSAFITSDKGGEGLKEIEQTFSYCREMGLDIVEFDPSLARGLDYYTGTTFEVFLREKDSINSAIAAGGRFDNLIGDFRNSESKISAVGISFGLERICMTMESVVKGLKETSLDLFIIPLKTLTESLKITHIIRKQNINVDCDLTGRSLKSAMRYANSIDAPFVAIVGQDEVKKCVITIKRLNDGLQNEVPFENVKSYLEEHKNT